MGDDGHGHVALVTYTNARPGSLVKMTTTSRDGPTLIDSHDVDCPLRVQGHVDGGSLGVTGAMKAPGHRICATA